MTTPFPFVASQVLTAQQLNDIQNLPISDKTASYTLIAGDETKRTMMNSASATTITVNDSIFTVGDVIQVANKGAGTTTITAGAGVTINTSGSLALAQYGGGYLVAISASSFVFFNLGSGANYGTATGGTSSSITVGGINYTLLTFTTDGTLTVTKAGLFDVLMFGGGAGGGASSGRSSSGGGGGAGGFIQSTLYLDTNQSIDIGAGGAGGTTPAGPGGSGLGSSINSAARSFGAPGGGGGGNISSSGNFNPQRGGCGGGGATASLVETYTGQTSVNVTVNGFGGGNATTADAGGGAGGGGGVTAVGAGGAGNVGGAGGAGYDVNAFTGAGSLFKGGGGGGGARTTGGAGGSSVGGAGGGGLVAGSAAAANTASGGGGGGTNDATGANGGAGGSGIVYVRFKV
jgi:hypothetical protein